MTVRYEATSLLNLMQDLPEERVKSILSSYSCNMNKDVELFLKNNSMEFSHASIARTFLVFAETDTPTPIAGFFALAPKSLLLKNMQNLSKTFTKKLNRFIDYHRDFEVQTLSVILIAQLGKNFLPVGGSQITGRELLNVAFEKITEIQRELGGSVVCVECENHPKLIAFYESNGFRHLQHRTIVNPAGSDESAAYLVQLIRYN